MNVNVGDVVLAKGNVVGRVLEVDDDGYLRVDVHGDPERCYIAVDTVRRVVGRQDLLWAERALTGGAAPPVALLVAQALRDRYGGRARQICVGLIGSDPEHAARERQRAVRGSSIWDAIEDA